MLKCITIFKRERNEVYLLYNEDFYIINYISNFENENFIKEIHTIYNELVFKCVTNELLHNLENNIRKIIDKYDNRGSLILRKNLDKYINKRYPKILYPADPMFEEYFKTNNRVY